jgi:hypothetical protein
VGILNRTQTKGFLHELSLRRTKELLKLNRNKFLWVVGLLIGLFKIGLTESPICERGLGKDESATHFLCE